MKKRLFLVCTLLAMLSPARAEVGDAFKGIWPVTDASVMKSLNGTWRLKVVKGVNADKKIPAIDASWGEIPVPGNWERYGFIEPRYSFPDSLTGYYRTGFQVPAEWEGRQVCIRLDGVLRGYDLWLNGKQVGSWELPYNTCIFDLTPYLTKKAFKGERQELSMRVYSHYQGYEFDCFDDWAPMGIFRDVTLFTVPKTHLSDLTVVAGTDGNVKVSTKVANATKKTKVEYEILDAGGRVVSTGEKIADPHPWTAETPYLYTLRLQLKQEGQVLQTFEQKIGLREMKIRDCKVLTLNGQPIKLRGVTSHATDPWTVKVISEERTLQDMKLMKEASINYIRTSHYPREPRFYELADSLGFYIICEVPFGSRGKKHLPDPTYYDNLLTRADATIRAHKNYPSVLIWSLGNENPLPESTQRLGYFAKSLDPSRYICYPMMGSTFRDAILQGTDEPKYPPFPSIAEIYAPHYPTAEVLKTWYAPADRPIIFTEYLHTLGISFEDHDSQWEIIESYPHMAGGSVWEWVDQGVPFEETRADRYGYEERVFTSPTGGFKMENILGTDGLLYADRTPLPNYYELQHNYAQASVVEESVVYDGRRVRLQVRNRYDFLNLKDNVTFQWAFSADRDTLASGAFSPDCAPHSSVPYSISLPDVSSDQLALLHVAVKNRQGRTLLRQSFRLAGAWKDCSASAGDLPVRQGPLVRVGRKMTMAESMRVREDRIERYLQPLDNPYVRGEVSREGEEVRYTLTPVGERHFLSEMGVAWLLDPAIDRVQWIGQGPFASYPGRFRANRYGFWSLRKDDLYFEGNRMGVDACWLSDAVGNGILISGDSPLNINFEQTDLGLVVTVNAAVSGQSPKFAPTLFGVWSDEVGVKTGCFRMRATEHGEVPPLFSDPSGLPDAFSPFYTQYDTYLMRYRDITPAGERPPHPGRCACRP